MARTLITYIGGKSLIAPWITGHYPKHYCYVEPFMGGCSTLFAKEPSKVEVINDIDNELVNFLMVLRNDPEKFKREVDTLPVARSLYEEWKWEDWPEDRFERAVRYWYIMRQAIGGYQRYRTGWKHAKTRNVAVNYYNGNQEILEFAARFRNVAIENLDFREIIKIYDGPETLFYCDPPYVGCEQYYQGSFSEADHRDLAKILSEIQGKAVVSYYECDLTEELYFEWWKVQKDVPKYSKVQLHGEDRPRAKEILYLNFDPADLNERKVGLFGAQP